MVKIFELFISPLGLPINPIYEYFILGAIEIVVLIISKTLAGRISSSWRDRGGWRLFFALVLFFVIWLVVRIVIWLYRNPKWACIIGAVVVVIVISIIAVHLCRKCKDKK